MIYDLQKANFWKRIAAWMFDLFLMVVLAVGFGTALSLCLGYDDVSARVDAAYSRYEEQYGVVFDISQSEYEAMTDGDRERYNLAYEALTADDQAMYDYNLMLNLTLVIISLGLLLSVLALEWAVPMCFGNGQTLGKKIFSLGLVRNDGVKLNNMQLFARMILGKYTIDTMIPVYVLLMLLWGTLDLTGTLLLMILLLAQVICLAVSKTNSALHDLLAGTVVVDISSQMIFRTTEDLIRYQKQIAADRAARQPY